MTADEMRYGAEFSPPQEPSGFIYSPQKKLAALIFDWYYGIHAIPSAFETRNVGVSIEWSFGITSDTDLVEVQYGLRHVHLLGFSKMFGPTSDQFAQPDFSNHRTQASLLTRPYTWSLVNVSVTRETQPNMEIFNYAPPGIQSE
jgi:hypothetical protein